MLVFATIVEVVYFHLYPWKGKKFPYVIYESNMQCRRWKTTSIFEVYSKFRLIENLGIHISIYTFEVFLYILEFILAMSCWNVIDLFKSSLKLPSISTFAEAVPTIFSYKKNQNWLWYQCNKLCSLHKLLVYKGMNLPTITYAPSSQHMNCQITKCLISSLGASSTSPPYSVAS